MTTMAMTKLLVVYGNSTTEENYEEMNLWYSWVHIRDVLTAKAAFAVQRFELSKYQPKNADTARKVLCCYEIHDPDYCQRWHVKDCASWRMRMSKSFCDYYETMWNPLVDTDYWADYADYTGDKSVMTVKMKAKGDVKVEDYFTLDKLNELKALPGFVALHLYDWTMDDQMPINTPPAEPMTHNLVCQISNCYAVVNEWEKFLAANPEVEELFEMHPAVYEPQMRRLRGIDLFDSVERRGIQALAHLTLDDKEGRANPPLPIEFMKQYCQGPLEGYCDIERRDFRDI